jgi:hypothetical protein
VGVGGIDVLVRVGVEGEVVAVDQVVAALAEDVIGARAADQLLVGVAADDQVVSSLTLDEHLREGASLGGEVHPDRVPDGAAFYVEAAN